MYKESQKNFSAIICCGGTSSRFGGDKLLSSIKNKFVFEHPLQTFFSHKNCKEIILIIPERWHSGVYLSLLKEMKAKLSMGKETRYLSIKSALNLVTEELVLIHDGARPLIKEETINSLCDFYQKKKCDGVVLTSKVSDLVLNGKNEIVDDPIIIQTPQLYRTSDMLKIYGKEQDIHSRDTSILFEKEGKKVSYLEGTLPNFKLTYKDDLKIIKNLLID